MTLPVRLSPHRPAWVRSLRRVAVRAGLFAVAAADGTVLSNSPTPATVQDVLRMELGDPSLRVRFWAPELHRYIDDAGRATVDESDASRRLHVPVVTSDDRPLAVVTAELWLGRQPRLVRAVVRANGLALGNARLHATALSQVLAMREARARIVQVELDERRRLERDLHDGAQQRLLSVATSIGLASINASGEHLRTLTRAGDDLREALRELRELARGLHPVLLTSEGLSAALQAVAERLPIDVHLDVDPGRSPPAVESTAYFVLRETLMNTVERARATRAAVTIRMDHHRLTFEVRDDGIGGADVANQEMSGMRDRIGALGGQLHVTSESCLGTAVTGWLPAR